MASVARERTHAKIHVENMQIIRYSLAVINGMACVDFFAKTCRVWANTARQLSDVLYDGERLAKLFLYVENEIQIPK